MPSIALVPLFIPVGRSASALFSSSVELDARSAPPPSRSNPANVAIPASRPMIADRAAMIGCRVITIIATLSAAIARVAANTAADIVTNPATAANKPFVNGARSAAKGLVAVINPATAFSTNWNALPNEDRADVILEPPIASRRVAMPLWIDICILVKPVPIPDVASVAISLSAFSPPPPCSFIKSSERVKSATVSSPSPNAVFISFTDMPISRLIATSTGVSPEFLNDSHV